MTAKIDDELLKRLEKAEPQQEIPVIVTVKPGADLSGLKQKGLKIEHTFDHIPAVSGTLTAAIANDVAQSDQVESIEYDGKVWAL